MNNIMQNIYYDYVKKKIDVTLILHFTKFKENATFDTY